MAGARSPGEEGVESDGDRPALAVEYLRLIRGLLSAPDQGAITQVVARFCVERFGTAVAAWAEALDPPRMVLVHVGGADEAEADSVRKQMQEFPPYTELEPSARARVRNRFCALVGAPSVDVLEAEQAVVMVAGDQAGSDRNLQGLADVLQAALHHRAEIIGAQRQAASLDLSLALTAHELRGPLLTSRVVIESIADAPNLGEKRAALNGAATLLSALAETVDGTLHWAAGTAKLRMRRIDLAIVVGHAAWDAAADAPSQLRLLASPSVPVMADPEHLRGAVCNVIRNALEHTPAGTPVEVGVGRQNGSAIVTVLDHGPGVPAPRRDSIFDSFVSGWTLDAGRGGRGLGLFITRRIVEAHGGLVWAETIGRASVFRISLPVAEDRE